MLSIILSFMLTTSPIDIQVYTLDTDWGDEDYVTITMPREHWEAILDGIKRIKELMKEMEQEIQDND